LVVAYNGAAYHGWQRQAGGLDTVQQRLEEACARVVRHPVTVLGAGRTDAGVHATGQVANFYTHNRGIPLSAVRRATNSRLPADIAVQSACEVPENFHASRSAIGKTYRYRIFTAPIRPVSMARQVCHYWMPLDDSEMSVAADRLVGKHDFRPFATSAETRPNTVRTVFRCDLARNQREITITVQGDGFLYNMVRNIVGTLIEVGRGRWQASQIDKIFASGSRQDAGPTARPDGLSLVCVHYRRQDLVVHSQEEGSET